MAFYKDAQSFEDVIQEVFNRLRHDPHRAAEFSRTNMVIQVVVTDPDVPICLNARRTPISFGFQPHCDNPSLKLHLTADDLHQIWLGEIRLRDAFFGGRIKTEGSVFKVMQLAPLFREAETLYPAVLRDKGYL